MPIDPRAPGPRRRRRGHPARRPTRVTRSTRSSSWSTPRQRAGEDSGVPGVLGAHRPRPRAARDLDVPRPGPRRWRSASARRTPRSVVARHRRPAADAADPGRAGDRSRRRRRRAGLRHRGEAARRCSPAKAGHRARRRRPVGGRARTRCSRPVGRDPHPDRDRARARDAGAPVRGDRGRARPRRGPRAGGAAPDHAAELWARFAAVAAGNELGLGPARPRRADAIAHARRRTTASIAMPYTKLLCSQWNVDQAAALVMMAAETATALGVARDRRVFPHRGRGVEPDGPAAAPGRDAPVARVRSGRRRARAHRRRTRRRRTSSTSTAASRPRCRCRRPRSASRSTRPLTVSGGMTFGGGPLNNSVLQAMVPFVRQLRERAGRARA